MDKKLIYDKLFSSWISAFPDKTKAKAQQECNQYWNSVKTSTNFKDQVEEKLKELEDLRIKSKRKITSFFTNLSQKTAEASASFCKVDESSPSIVNQSSASVEPTTSEASLNNSSGSLNEKRYPAQQRLENQLAVVDSELALHVLREKSGMSTENANQKVKALEKQRNELRKEIKKLVDNRKHAQGSREKKRKALEEAMNENPGLAAKLRVTEKKGRPTIIETQTELLSTIAKIATYGSAAADKRRSEILRTVKTLDELTDALHKEGFSISRSSVYYHLAPKNSRTVDGKRHVTTVPVRLIKATNDLHRSHPDSKFCFATIQNLLELASFLGPSDVSLISQDDKAKVPIGLPAASIQSPLLMHLDYKVKLPDHDFVIAPSHRLTPSVYAALKIETNGYGNKDFVSYSGPTFISIRSAKHTSSTAYSHARDFSRLFKIEAFNNFMCSSDGLPKPVLIQLVDGGPDENPRYQKVIEMAVHNFMEYSLDTIIIAMNAPGRSAFNQVERRMAPLSRQLSGLILPHETYGSHLDAAGKTIDDELEKENFQAAGEALSEVFSSVVIDNYQTIAEFVDTSESEINPNFVVKKDEIWFSTHVRSSQYMLQISKCNDENCCAKPRGKFFEIVPDRFLPGPTSLSYDPFMKTESYEEHFRFTTLFQSLHISEKNMPYDKFCPSLRNIISERICDHCNAYFASLTLLKNHKKIHPKQRKIRAPKAKKIFRKENNHILAQVEDEVGEKTIEWIDTNVFEANEFDALKEVPTVSSQAVESTIQIVSIDDHLKNLWETIEKILVFCYVRMFMEIKKHSQRLRTNSTVEEDFILSQQKKVTITLFIVLATFVMMALPYHVYATYTTIEKDKTHFPTYINPLAYMFLYLSSMCNPIIYAFRSPAFREGYKEILCQTPNYVISDESDQVPRTRRISFLISSLRQASSFRSANRNVKICPESRALNPKHRESGDNQSKPKFGRQKSLLELLRSTRRSRGQSVVHRNGDVIIMKGGKIVSVRREATPFLDKFNTLKETNERDKRLAAGLAGPGHVMFGLLYEGEENGAVKCDKDVTESNTSLASRGKLKEIHETGFQNDEMSRSQENGLSLSHLENKNISSTEAHVDKFIFNNDDQKYSENESASLSEQSQYSTSGIELSNSEVARPTFLQFAAKGLSETDISEDTGNNFKMTSLPDYLTSSIESAINSPNSGGVVIQLDDDDDIISVMPLTPNTREHLAKSELNISQTRPDPTLGRGQISQLSQSSEHILKRPPAIARLPSVEFLDPPIHVFRSQSNVSMHKGRSKSPRRRERSQSPDVNLSSKSSFLLSHFSPRRKHTMQL